MTLFYRGQLKDAIAQAIHESKHVACFIKDESSESCRWEDEYLQDSEVAAALHAKAVLIPLRTGSQEAAYLAAFYPVSAAPSFVIIKNGTLCGDLHAGLSLPEFKRALLDVLECSSVENATNNENHRVGAAEASSNLHQRASAESSSISQEISSSSNTNIETVLEERRKRLEADKQRKDDAAKVEQLKQAEMRKAELKKAPTSPALAEQIPYAQQQRKRQQEAREERERILRVIENDKIERKRKEELRKALANADAQETTEHHDGADGLIDQQLSRDIDLTIPARSAVCALQVRLLDGRVIRSEFSFESTLRVDVRRWVEEQESMRKVPYNFRQILMPQPNRLISVSEEEEPLHSLGFIPNATLVTVPIMNYVNAHPHESGLVSRALSVGYNGISEGFGWFSGFFYKRQTSIVEAPTMENTHGSSSTNSTRLKQGTNVRMLRDGLSDPVEEQFYNGNQLNFEPRNDDE